MFKKVDVFRVKPGQELATELTRYCRQNNITSAVVLGIIGSVTSAKLNFLTELPGKYVTEEYSEPLEIVSSSMCISSSPGKTCVGVGISMRLGYFPRPR